MTSRRIRKKRHARVSILYPTTAGFVPVESGTLTRDAALVDAACTRWMIARGEWVEHFTIGESIAADAAASKARNGVTK